MTSSDYTVKTLEDLKRIHNPPLGCQIHIRCHGITYTEGQGGETAVEQAARYEEQRDRWRQLVDHMVASCGAIPVGGGIPDSATPVIDQPDSVADKINLFAAELDRIREIQASSTDQPHSNEARQRLDAARQLVDVVLNFYEDALDTYDAAFRSPREA